MVQKFQFWFLLFFSFVLFFGVFNKSSCSAAEDPVTTSSSARTWPKYTEIRRKRPQTTAPPPPTVPTETEIQEVEDEIPRIVSNGRGEGHSQNAMEDREDEKKTEIVESEKSQTVDVTSISTQKSPGSGGKRYLEYFRHGSRPMNKPKRTTTRAPPKQSYIEESEEIVDDNKRPDACNECRFYCKRCRGAEEVTTGGVWGCCNHNCCGGRCSCQKVKSS